MGTWPYSQARDTRCERLLSTVGVWLACCLTQGCFSVGLPLSSELWSSVFLSSTPLPPPGTSSDAFCLQYEGLSTV